MHTKRDINRRNKLTIFTAIRTLEPGEFYVLENGRITGIKKEPAGLAPEQAQK